MDSQRLFCCSCQSAEDEQRGRADIGVLYRVDPDGPAEQIGIETDGEITVAQSSMTPGIGDLSQVKDKAESMAEGFFSSLGWSMEDPSQNVDELQIGPKMTSSSPIYQCALINSSHEDQKDSLGWVNYILHSTWSHTRTALNDLAIKIVSQEVKAAIRQRNLRGFNIDISLKTHFDIGSSPPVLKNIVATHTGVGSQEGIELLTNLEMSAADDFHFELAISGRVSGLPVNTSVGLRSFSLYGNACVLLAPLIDSMPIFAGGKIYFLDLPNLHIAFFGMQSAGKLLGPILVAAVQTTAEQILQSFVVPGGIYVPIAPIPPVNLLPIATPPPFGYVLVTVYQARGVFGGDWSLFSKETSDPSVTIKLGGTSFITSYHTNTSHPVWDPPECGFLPLFHQNQQLYIDVTDVDLGDRRDLLGQHSGTVQRIHERLQGKAWLEMELTDIAKAAGGDDPPPMEVLLKTEYLQVVKLDPLIERMTELPKGDAHQFGGPHGLSVDYVPLLRLCSVKLMGMESPDEWDVESLLHSTAYVTIEPGPPPKNFFKEKKGGVLARGLEAIGRRLSLSDTSGGTLKQPPMKSKKARAWGAAQGVAPKGSYMNNVSAHAQLMIERLAKDRKMSFAEIAEISGLAEAQVQLLVEMQRTLHVVWYQSFHRLLEYPGGKVTVEVIQEDKTSLGKVTVDLEEVEGSESKTLEVRRPLSGRQILVFHIELQGLERASMAKRRGHKSYQDNAFTKVGRKVITATKTPTRLNSFKRGRSTSSNDNDGSV